MVNYLGLSKLAGKLTSFILLLLISTDVNCLLSSKQCPNIFAPIVDNPQLDKKNDEIDK